VKILVIVAIIQIKNLKIVAEKGFRRTLFGPELVDPNSEINFVKGFLSAMTKLNLLTRRKGNNSNNIIHVHKEVRAT
jgi:hypothetical protein